MELNDVDIPIGRGPPELHPKRQQLTRLVNQHAPEYARADKWTAFRGPEHDGLIRSKHAIITSIIEELMTDGGCFVIKKDRVWVVKVGFNSDTKQVRDLVQDQINRIIRSWKGDLRPLPPLDESQPAQNNDEQGYEGSVSLDDAHIEVHQQPDEKDDDQLHYAVEQLNRCEIVSGDVFFEAQKPPDNDILPPDGKMMWGFFKSSKDADGGESDRIPEAVSETSSSSDDQRAHVSTLSRESSGGEYSMASEQHLDSDGVLPGIKQQAGMTFHNVSATVLLESPTPTSSDDLPEVQDGSRKLEMNSELDKVVDSSLKGLSRTPSFELFPPSELEVDAVVMAESGLSPPPNVASQEELFQHRRKRTKLGVFASLGLVAMALTVVLLVVVVPNTGNKKEELESAPVLSAPSAPTISRQPTPKPTFGVPTASPLPTSPSAVLADSPAPTLAESNLPTAPLSSLTAAISRPWRSCLENEFNTVLVFDDFEDTAGNWTTDKTTLLEFDDGNHTNVLGLFDRAFGFPQTEVGIPNDIPVIFLTFDYYIVSDQYVPYSLGVDFIWGAGNVTEVDFGLFNVVPRRDKDKPTRSKEVSSDLVWSLDTQDYDLNMEHHYVRIWMGSKYVALSKGQLGVKIRWALPNRATPHIKLGIDNFSITGCRQLVGSSDVTYSGAPTLLPSLSPSMQSSLASLRAPFLEPNPSPTRSSSPSQPLQKSVSSTSGPSLAPAHPPARPPSSAMPVSLLTNRSRLVPSLSPTSTPSIPEVVRSQQYTQLPSAWRTSKSPSQAPTTQVALIPIETDDDYVDRRMLSEPGEIVEFAHMALMVSSNDHHGDIRDENGDAIAIDWSLTKDFPFCFDKHVLPCILLEGEQWGQYRDLQ